VIEPVFVQDRENTDKIRWNLLYRKTQELRVLHAFTLFREQEIEPILIKGLAAAQCYPESRSRASIDVDLAVSAKDFETANRISRSEAATGLAIDLHRELRHLDTVKWNDLFENSQLLEVEGGSIRVLRPEDHLRVLIVHWLTNGGSDKDRLWDVYFMIDNRPADFDWARFLNSVGDRRRRWLICTVGLAHRFLGLDIDDSPIKDEARDIPEWLIKAVEAEWASETKNWPLEACINDPKLFLKQVLKRMRPNPIWATIQVEGSFDAKTRLFYQIANFFMRIPSSYRRVSATLNLRLK
jgi:hypothetical protein